MKKKLCKNRKQRSQFKVVLYSNEYGTNNDCDLVIFC